MNKIKTPTINRKYYLVGLCIMALAFVMLFYFTSTTSSNSIDKSSMEYLEQLVEEEIKEMENSTFKVNMPE
jgi:hypothetical protein